jgi:hypothetical protein
MVRATYGTSYTTQAYSASDIIDRGFVKEYLATGAATLDEANTQRDRELASRTSPVRISGATITGSIYDQAGAPWPGYWPRAGESARILDNVTASSQRDMLIYHTGYNFGAQVLQLDLDNEPRRLS